jgi:hypothetical protein
MSPSAASIVREEPELHPAPGGSAQALLRNLCAQALEAHDWDERAAMEAARAQIHGDSDLHERVAWLCLTETVRATIARLVKAEREREKGTYGRRLTGIERMKAAELKRVLMDEQLAVSKKPLRRAVRPEVHAEKDFEKRQAREHWTRAVFFAAVAAHLRDDVVRVCEALSEQDLRGLWRLAEERRERNEAQVAAVRQASASAIADLMPKGREVERPTGIQDLLPRKRVFA